MDFLAGYGSGSDDPDSDLDQQGAQAARSESINHDGQGINSSQKAKTPSTPPPGFFDATETASLVAGSVTEDLLTSGGLLPASASAPAAADAPAVSEELLTKLLPPPSASAARRVVAVQLPAHKALLASAHRLKASEGEDAPAKRVKPNPGAKKSSLMSFLPPPKNTPTVLGSGTGLDGVSKRGPSTNSSEDSDVTGTSGSAGFEAAVAAAAARQKAQAQLAAQPLWGNEMYRASVDQDDLDAEDMADPVYSGMWQGYGGAAGTAYHPSAAFAVPSAAAGASHEHQHQQQYGHHEQHYDHQQQYYDTQQYQPQNYQRADSSGHAHASGSGGEGGQRAAQAAAASGSVDALFEEAVRAEREKANKRGRGKELPPEVQFLEIKQAELTFSDTSQQTASEGLRGALGVQFAAQQRAAAQEFEGNKMAKRKHQIGTLFYNAKMKELEMMEKRASGIKKGQSTQAKYGF